MHRFLLKGEAIEGRYELSKEELHHLQNVLRIKNDSEIIVFDGRGKEYLALFKEDESGFFAEIIRETTEEREAVLKIKLFQGVPKGEKMELIIQKCTELGVSEIIPVLSSRCVVQLEEGKAEKKRQRWQKIAEEAAKQCRRSMIPPVRKPSKFSEIIADLCLEDDSVVLWENEDSLSLREALESFEQSELNIFVGPEGGWSEEEIAALQEKGVRSVTLGKRILRTETAAITATVIALYRAGDLG